MKRKPTKTRAALAALSQGVKRLERAPGDTAKRNGRADVLKALRSLRAAVDLEHPVPRRKGKRSRIRRTGDALARGLVVNGYVAIHTATTTAVLAAAGVRVIKADHKVYAPRWAVIFATRGHTASKIRIAKRRPSVRRALLAQIELAKLSGDRQ